CLDKLADIGVESSDGTVILRREISHNGKSVCRVNGKMMTLAFLKDIGRLLVDIHGQHEHQDLLKTERHLPLLDNFGDTDLHHAFQDYISNFETYKGLEK